MICWSLWKELSVRETETRQYERMADDRLSSWLVLQVTVRLTVRFPHYTTAPVSSAVQQHFSSNRKLVHANLT